MPRLCRPCRIGPGRHWEERNPHFDRDCVVLLLPGVPQLPLNYMLADPEILEFFDACVEGDEETVKVLLHQQKIKNVINYRGIQLGDHWLPDTPFYVSVLLGHVGVARALARTLAPDDPVDFHDVRGSGNVLDLSTRDPRMMLMLLLELPQVRGVVNEAPSGRTPLFSMLENLNFYPP